MIGQACFLGTFLAVGARALTSGRDLLPSRPAPSKAFPAPFNGPPTVLDGSRLVDMARVGGGAVVSPDGSMAAFEVGRIQKRACALTKQPIPTPQFRYASTIGKKRSLTLSCGLRI